MYLIGTVLNRTQHFRSRSERSKTEPWMQWLLMIQFLILGRPFVKRDTTRLNTYFSICMRILSILHTDFSTTPL